MDFSEALDILSKRLPGTDVESENEAEADEDDEDDDEGEEARR
jgi:hypothetical protein